jgi:hypothetical protein
MIKSYSEALTAFNTARWPDKGKPITNWARMYKHSDDSLVVNVYGIEMFVFRPDNTLEIVCNGHEARSHAVTLAQALHRHLPFHWTRRSTGVYEVRLIDENTFSGYWKDISEKLDASPKYEIYKGIKFDLNTNTCMNPRVSEISTVVPEKRKIWLRKIKAYNKALQVRARIGVCNTVVEQIQRERRGAGRWEQPDWGSEEWMSIWVNAIDTGNIPVVLLKGIAQSERYGWLNSTTPQLVAQLLKTAKNLQSTYSRELRRRFGVFG